MAKSTTFSGEILKLIFNGTAIGTLATNGTATTLYLALHTADPGNAGNQSTNEVTYTGYARASVTRTTASFTITNATASFAAAVSFPESTGTTSVTATHLSIGTAATGTGDLLYNGALSTPILIQQGTTPVIKAGSSVLEA
jgi:hypothetical protein